MRKVLFYPDPPIQVAGHSLSKTIKYFTLIGYGLKNDINDDWDVGVYWDYGSVNKTPQALLDDKRLVLNKRCNNITKSYVDKIFTQVFGYSSLADTTKYGYCVKKSEEQSAHDGVMTQTPCVKSEGSIYQLLIDNRMDIDMVYDIRVPIFLGEIPLVFIKCKSIEGTFEYSKSTRLKYWVDKTENYITAEEEKKIKVFCRKVGLDIGEIDALRDNSTGRLYITDINNIPGGDVFGHIKDGDEVEKQLSLFLEEKLIRNIYENKFNDSLSEVRVDESWNRYFDNVNVRGYKRYSFCVSYLYGSVLDVGSGDGFGAYMMSKNDKIKEITCLEVQDKAIEKARKNMTTISIVKGIAEHMPFPDKNFDSVHCGATMEHVFDDKMAMKEIHRVVKDVVVFSIPIYGGISLQHVREYSEDSFKELTGLYFDIIEEKILGNGTKILILICRKL